MGLGFCARVGMGDGVARVKGVMLQCIAALFVAWCSRSICISLCSTLAHSASAGNTGQCLVISQSGPRRVLVVRASPLLRPVMRARLSPPRFEPHDSSSSRATANSQEMHKWDILDHSSNAIADPAYPITTRPFASAARPNRLECRRQKGL